MTKLPKVGDRVKLKSDQIGFSGVSPGQIAIVTQVRGRSFSVNYQNHLQCKPSYWIKMKPKKKSNKTKYIVSKQILEAVSKVPGTMGDEVVVVIKDEQ